MDPMLQLATNFLKVERPESRTEPKFPEDIDKQIREEIKRIYSTSNSNQRWNSCPLLQEILWDLRDERAAEVLANVFYAKPEIAKRLCEIRPDLCPGFIKYLVGEAGKEWQAGKARKEWPPKRDLRDLLAKHGYDPKATFPTGLTHDLITKPELVEDLADLLNVALPFSLVLRKELREVSRSRNKRLAPDPNAGAAKHLNVIYGIHTSLNRLKAFGTDEHQIEEKEAQEHRIREQMWEESRMGKGPHIVDGNPPTQGDARIYPPAQAEKMCLFGIALSGGGIRSATFNLGVLQGMADLDLLRRVDYLSGVSGGAHIGGWLAAWIKREHEGVRRVQRWLSPVRSPTPDTDETHPIQFLRRFSNYLAPRKGFLSADTWAMLSVWLRNTVLNQIVFVLLLAAILSVPRLIFALLYTSEWLKGPDAVWIGVVVIVLAALLALRVGVNLRHFDREHRAYPHEKRRSSPLRNQFGVISTVVSGVWLLGLLGSTLIAWSTAFYSYRLLPLKTFWLPAYLILFGGLLISLAAGRTWRCFFSDRLEEEVTRTDQVRAIGWTILFAAVSAFVGWCVLRAGVAFYGKAILHDDMLGSIRQNFGLLANYCAEIIVFGPAAVVALLSLVYILQIGLMGRNLPDTRREWWGRLGATLLIALSGWTALSYCALYGPWLVLWLGRSRSLLSLSVILWLITTFMGSRWGSSGQTPAFPIEEKETRSAKRFEWILRTAPREWITKIAPYFFVIGLAISLSFLLYVVSNWMHYHQDAISKWLRPDSVELNKWMASISGDWLCRKETLNDCYWNHSFSFADPLWLLPVMMLLALLLAMLLAWRFDVNEFSMYNFYRNRLVRCYLGASRARGTRDPNPFTGFDPEDDLRIADLQVKPPDLLRAAEAYYGPFPIINTTLNLVAGKELAWQERKAASFTFTPLYCGYELATGTEYRKRNFANYGYRPTVGYAEPRFDGPSLGTAFAISGAAINPNMGYHSSPALSFLMALFNARLGCWLGNTRHCTSWKKSSPKLGLPYLINELLGNTNDTSWFINLSDGGHFENLGLYELVRRRCMFIIVSDAEEDPVFAFGGLGNAIRKCRTDFGVDIRLDPDHLRPVPVQGRSRTHCAAGEIIYSPDARGILLYIKTSLSGDEPADVLQYKLRHSAFPHQSTLNQFFDESQFESYRALGKHIAMAILKRASQSSSEEVPDQPAKKPPGKIKGFWRRKPLIASHTDRNKELISKMFHYLHAMWYPATENIVALSEQHSRLYADLVEKFRSGGKDLADTARAFFRNHQKPSRLNSSFYVYALMIELMHRVFLDLNLETTADHPHNEGWMNLFRDWAKDKSFKRAWNVVQGNYDIRFRSFCDKEFIQFELKRSRRHFPWIWRAA